MPTLNGKAILWGNEITYAAVITDTAAIPTDATFSRSADTDELLNADGSLVGKAYYNLSKRFTITAVPCDRNTGPSVADAKTNMDALLPAVGTKVTLADAHSGVTDGTHTAGYQVTRATLRTSNTAPATCELEVVQYDANDITGAVT